MSKALLLVFMGIYMRKMDEAQKLQFILLTRKSVNEITEETLAAL